MAFPSSPTNGQIHTVGNREFQWNATLGAWKRYANGVWQQYKFSRLTTNLSITGLTTVALGVSGVVTLSSSDNKVMIQSSINHIISTGNGSLIIDLYRNGAKIEQLYNASAYTGDYDIHATFIDSPGSVGPHTYALYATTSSVSAGFVIEGTTSPSSLLIAELKG